MTDKFVTKLPLPTPHERELLTILSEEAAEVIEAAAQITLAASGLQQRASKSLRFGLDEVQPGQELTNAQRLGNELGDLAQVQDKMIAAEVITANDWKDGYLNKKDRQLRIYMQTTPETVE